MGWLDPGGLFSSPNDLDKFTRANYEDRRIQGFLPEPLRKGNVYPGLRAGIAGIGELMKNPGGMNPNISQAIAPRLANESQSIAQNFRGLGQNQAGMAARSNLPVSIKAALEAAMGTNQERAQRDARNTAMYDSEQLRRTDLEQVYKLLDAMLGFTASGRGQSMQAYSKLLDTDAQHDASILSAIGSLMTGGMGGIGGAKS